MTRTGIFLLGLALAMPAAASFRDGMTALQRGEHEQAFTLLEREAVRGHLEAQYQVGLMYFEGRGTPVRARTTEGRAALRRTAPGRPKLTRRANRANPRSARGRTLP